MSELHEYKCPCCDGSITFDTASQKMKCPFCGTEFDVESLRHYDEELKNEEKDEMKWESAGSEWQDGEREGLRTYGCNMCGGQIIGDATLAATECPFCGSAVIMMGQFAGDLRPDLVIPFKLDKKAAKEALRKHYGNKLFLPKEFKDENHIDEVKGIYVPFWLFDAEADANIRYRATRVRTWSDRSYIYTDTSFYSVVRGGTLGFEHVPVDGSSKMPDALMESIEPFDFSQATDFQTAYLSGYFADKYDVDDAVSIKRANERVRVSTVDKFASTVLGYATIIPEATSINLKNSKAKYALLPVWMLNTTWNGTKYTFAMNGQTGKFVGDMPVDKGKLFRWLFGLTGAIGAIGMLILSILYWIKEVL